METTKTPAMPDMSIIGYAKDAADTLKAVCDAEKAPLTSGYILIATTDKGDRSLSAYYGKLSHLVDGICNAIQQTEQGWQIFSKVMDELERRSNDYIKNQSQTLNK